MDIKFNIPLWVLITLGSLVLVTVGVTIGKKKSISASDFTDTISFAFLMLIVICMLPFSKSKKY